MTITVGVVYSAVYSDAAAESLRQYSNVNRIYQVRDKTENCIKTVQARFKSLDENKITNLPISMRLRRERCWRKDDPI